MSPQPATKRRSIGLSVVLALAFGIVSCDNNTPQPGGRARSRFQSQTVAVRVVSVKEGQIIYTIRATGTAVPDTTIKLSARAEAQVLEIKAREGDRVEKGQTLVLQDNAVARHQHELALAEARAAEAHLAKLVAGNRPEEVAASEAQVAQAQALAARVRAEVQSAHAKKKEAETNASMYERMFRQGIVSPQQRLSARTQAEATAASLSEMEAKLRENEAALKAAKARLRLMRAGTREEDVAAARSELNRARENANLLRVKMEHAQTVAPISGVVSERIVEPGDLARVGSHMLTLVNTERLRIRTQISELDLPKVQVGQVVHVTFDAYPSRKFTGKVQRIFPTIDPNSRQATAEVVLENPSGKIPSGLLARVTFVSRSPREALIIPKAALVRRVQGDRHEVFVVKKSAAPGRPNANGPHPSQPGPANVSRNGGTLSGKPVLPASVAADGAKAPPSRTNKPQGPGRGGGPPATHVAESRKVVVGEIEGDLAEVRSGLSPGDLVVVKGKTRLRPGSSVKIVQ